MRLTRHLVAALLSATVAAPVFAASSAASSAVGGSSASVGHRRVTLTATSAGTTTVHLSDAVATLGSGAIQLYCGPRDTLPPRFHRMYRLLHSAVLAARRKLPAIALTLSAGRGSVGCGGIACLMDDGPQHTAVMALCRGDGGATAGTWHLTVRMRRGVVVAVPPHGGDGPHRGFTLPLRDPAVAAALPLCVKSAFSVAIALYSRLVAAYDALPTDSQLPVVQPSLEAAAIACKDMLEQLVADSIDIGIFDATNTTRERRRWLRTCLQECETANGLRIQLVFIETICNDEGIIRLNVQETKLKSPDYHGKSESEAVADFLRRITMYESVYQTLTDDEEGDTSYIKIVDVGRQLIGEALLRAGAPRLAPQLAAAFTSRARSRTTHQTNSQATACKAT
mgnify:CR=1 FL=1